MNVPFAQRNESLDILRAIAVLLVLGDHFDHYHAWQVAGRTGVDLFFVLSGFLISGLLFKELHETGTIDYWRFILRRGFKIWPSFYALVLGVFLITVAVAGYKGSNLLRFAATAVFIQNYDLPHWMPALLAHTWSLAIEEHFYIALPLVLLLLGRKRISAIPVLFAAVALVCLFLRWNADRAGIPYFVYRTHLRIDGLMAGVAIAYFYRFQQKRFRYLSNRLALAVSPFLFLPPMLIREQNRFAQIYGVTALYMGFGVLLAFCVDRDLGRFLGRPVTRVLARIGRDSYCIYLWHYPISRIFGGPLSAVQFWTFLVLSVAIGVCASSLIERPFLRLRENSS